MKRSSKVESAEILSQIIKSNNPRLRKHLILGLPDSVIKLICEVMHNILQGNVPIRGKQREKFQKYKHTIRLLGKGPFKPLVKKRKTLVNQRGGFIGTILPIIASILLSSNV